MYYLKTKQSFDAAHFLKGYDGKCSNIHGHRWQVVAQIRATDLSEEPQTLGMVVDFGDLKAALKTICNHFDHCLIYEAGSLRPLTLQALNEEGFRLVEVPFRPTAEHFARHIHQLLKAQGYTVDRIEVYETPNNCAIYEEEA